MLDNNPVELSLSVVGHVICGPSSLIVLMLTAHD